MQFAATMRKSVEQIEFQIEQAKNRSGRYQEKLVSQVYFQKVPIGPD